MKKIIICCDGTWAESQPWLSSVRPTNVAKLSVRIAKRDADDVSQITYYQEGVGTGNLVDTITGGAFGDGLEDNINAAYRFLVANYEKGDELFVFGFSRGAFTARSLVGMIRKCGIVDRAHIREGYRDALALYHGPDGPDDPEPQRFRRENTVNGLEDVQVRFVGVWDTVGSLGIPLRSLRWITASKYQFHDTELSGSVKEAYQALAIDEHRGPFEPSIWDCKRKDGQLVQQVWFCGSHCNVGGGLADKQLSDISLEWMMEKARGAGLAFDAAAIDAYPLKPNPLGPLFNSMNAFYRFLLPFDRVIGKTHDRNGGDERDDETQSLHPSVLERYDKDPSYRPANLVEYLKRHPRATGHTTPAVDGAAPAASGAPGRGGWLLSRGLQSTRH